MQMTSLEKLTDRTRHGHPWECWPYMGRRDPEGYGKVSHAGRELAAHRVAVGLEPGDPSCALHRCDNPPCVNPAHLFIGSKADNTADMIAKGRSSSKLTREDVDEIRELYATGLYSQVKMGEMYGVSSSQIGRIVLRQRWK